MFNQYNKQSDVLEKFRIHAHLRSYVKEPIIIDETLLQEAVIKLKKLPYVYKDPTDSVAIELVIEAYRLGYFKYKDLTDTGYKLVRHGKHRRQPVNASSHKIQLLRNRYTLKTI